MAMDELIDVLGYPKAFDKPVVKRLHGNQGAVRQGKTSHGVITNRKQRVGVNLQFLQSGHRIVFIQLNFTGIL